MAMAAVMMYKNMDRLRFLASSCFSLRMSLPESTVTRAAVRMNTISTM